MTCSMTAFARQQTETPAGAATWEIRSVNSRYLELHFRLPDEYRELEPTLRDLCKSRLSRGKVELFLRLQESADSSAMTVNRELLAALQKASKEIEDIMPDAAPATTLQVLQWPGVLAKPQSDKKEIHKQLLDGFSAALEQLINARKREGEALTALINSRCERVSELAAEADKIMPQALAAQRSNLLERLGELRESLDTERLEQEMLLLAQKADIAEETDRLRAHIQEVQDILTRDEPIGRRLDFMMQELNREANTLSSKALHKDLTRTGVEIKVLIEQMREQVQNIE